MGKHGKLRFATLRLLPLSSGIFAGAYAGAMPRITMIALVEAVKHRSEEQQHRGQGYEGRRWEPRCDGASSTRRVPRNGQRRQRADPCGGDGHGGTHAMVGLTLVAKYFVSGVALELCCISRLN